MKAVMCRYYGSPDTLSIEEIPSPIVQDNKVLIKVKACSANFPDTLIIKNLYQFKPELPFSPGSEVSGIIKEVGDNVKHLKVDQRVLALCGWGGFADEVLVESSRVFPIPEEMDFITAASLMYNYGTSYHALKDRGNIKQNETLLVLGAAGGVGLAAVELGKLLGAKVIAAASSEEKLKVCIEKGADFIINYETEDLREKINEFTNGNGVDLVFDPIGDKFSEPCIRSMAWNGRYLVVGFAAGNIPKIALNLALLKGCSIVGVFWGQFAAKEKEKNQKNINELATYFFNGNLKPNIYKIYSLQEAPFALQDLIERKVIGKAVVVTDFYNDLTVPKTIPLIDFKSIKENQKIIFDSVSQIKNYIGKSLGTTDWLQITQEMINKFADATFDSQWIHLDESKAKNSLFGKTIAHGHLTLSLSPMFLNQLYEIKNLKMGVNYGTEKVRFISPVYSESRIRLSAILKSATDMPNNGLKMVVEAKYEIQNQEKLACLAELISIVYI
jgi:NADPH2:quinone reductase